MPSRAVSEADTWRLTAPTSELAVAVGYLRPWQSPDASALAAAWSDAEIARWNQVPDDPTEELARNWIGRWNARLTGGHALDLAVIADQSVAGEVGISGVNAHRRAGLIGYWTARAHRGRGIAGQAVNALADWALDSGGFTLLVARCHEANAASQRTAASAGFEYEMTEPDGPQLWVRRA